jgi:hypothetical protein
MRGGSGYQAPSTAFLTGGRAKLELGGGKQDLGIFSPYESLPEALFICADAHVTFCAPIPVVVQDANQPTLHGVLCQEGEAIASCRFVATQLREYVHKGIRLHWPRQAPFGLSDEQLGDHHFGVPEQGLTISRHDGAYLCGGSWGQGSLLQARQMMVYIKDVQGQIALDVALDPRPQAPSIQQTIAMGGLRVHVSWQGFLFSYQSRSVQPASLDHQLWIEFIPG